MQAMKKSLDWFSDHLEPPVEETIYSLQHADVFVLSSLDVHASYETLLNNLALAFDSASTF